MPSQVDGNSRPFAAKLRGLMREHRITIDALAEQSNVSWRQIARYRAGEAEPRDSFGDPSPNAHKLAAVFGMSVDELLAPVNGDRGPESEAA